MSELLTPVLCSVCLWGEVWKEELDKIRKSKNPLYPCAKWGQCQAVGPVEWECKCFFSRCTLLNPPWVFSLFHPIKNIAPAVGNAWSRARSVKFPCGINGFVLHMGSPVLWEEKSSPPQEGPRIYEEFDLCLFLRKEFVSPVQEFQCCHQGLDLTRGGKWGIACQKEAHEPCDVVWATTSGISGNIWEIPSLVSGSFLV